MNFYEILPHWNIITSIGDELCSDGSDSQEFCVSFLKAMAGSVNEKELNKVSTHR